MTKLMIPRYAIYYAPEPGNPLEAFGNVWLGNGGGAKKLGKLDGTRVAELTESTRRYGFHGTLKPPFELNPASSPGALLSAAHVFATSLAPVEIPPLELVEIGKFIALAPTSQSAALEKLAAACVRAFEAYRMPLSEQQIVNYKHNKLTVHQEQMLEHWGYPYVMEEFCFHISLTDRIDDDREREDFLATLRELAKPIIGRPVRVSELTVFGQSGLDQPMKPIERIPFGHKK